MTTPPGPDDAEAMALDDDAEKEAEEDCCIICCCAIMDCMEGTEGAMFTMLVTDYERRMLVVQY